MRSFTLFVVLCASVAHAQFIRALNGQQLAAMYTTNGAPLISSLQGAHLDEVLAGKQRAFSSPLTATDLVPTGPRNVPLQVAEAASTEQDRVALVKLCRDVQEALEQQPKLRKNNLAMALEVLLGVSLQVARGRVLTEPEGEQLQRAINDALAGSDKVKKLTAAQRTLAYDTFLISGGLIAGLAQSGKDTKDEALTASARDLAIATLKKFGL